MSTPAAPPAAPNHYVNRFELAERIRDYKRTGVLSLSLVEDLLRIAKGVNDRYRFGPDDDFAHDCWIHLVYQAPLKRVDPDRNPFAFFTTCAIRFGMRKRNKAAKEQRQAADYRELVAYRDGADPLSGADPGDYGTAGDAAETDAGDGDPTPPAAVPLPRAA